MLNFGQTNTLRRTQFTDIPICLSDIFWVRKLNQFKIFYFIGGGKGSDYIGLFLAYIWNYFGGWMGAHIYM